MPPTIRAASGFPGGPSEIVSLSRRERSEATAKPSEFQHQSRRRFAEASDLAGAAQFAAEALGRHFARRAVMGSNAHG